VLGAQIEARARDPELADRVLVRKGVHSWTYRGYRDECVRTAHFLLNRLSRLEGDPPGHVAVLLENQPEFLSLYGGCGYAGLTLFGLNTGLRGETLAHLRPENVLVLPTIGEHDLGGQDLRECLAREVAKSGEALEPPAVEVTPETPLVVIYTSGTTGLPKGIINSHFKLLAIGLAVSSRMELGPEDVGYACMPLFHSNALFLGFQPTFHVGGSLALRERFSASAFVRDVLEYGVTYWNYVGEPVHYILAALEREYGGEARILEAVAAHPRNRLRYALGNGASSPDIDRFTRWMGLEDMFELYGSTEATISTFRRKGDPRGSVGEITDADVKILNEDGAECPPAEIDETGHLTNYAACVGEICRVAPETGLFQGYFENEAANASKYRERPGSGRQAVPLLRWANRRLDPEGRGELLGRPGGSIAPGASRRRPGGRLRGPLHGLGRARHGSPPAASRVRVRRA
jgi:fatty-acyl-CoA synthase